MEIKIEGLEKLLNEFKIAANNISRDTAETLENTANNIINLAKDSMKEGHGIPSNPGEPPHKQTHNLAESIDITKLSDHSFSIGTDVDYGKDLEFGTSTMEARPWLRPAFEQGGKNLIKDLTEDINKGFS